MTKIDSDVLFFSRCMSEHAITTLDRSIAFLYFYEVKSNSSISLSQIVSNFRKTGLGNPNITRLRRALVKDRRTIKFPKDMWRLKSDRITEVEKQFQLDKCLGKKPTKQIAPSGRYVNKRRFQELKKIKSRYDFTRLLKMLSELDSTFEAENYISVILLVRAILDHISPIFDFNTFPELANNYKGAKSFKESMLNLENSSRKIADTYLHVKIRNKETLPNSTQVNFSNDLDVLLAEIIRIS